MRLDLQHLSRWLWRPGQPGSAPRPQGAPRAGPVRAGQGGLPASPRPGFDPAIHYPPVDPGLPACSVQEIVHSQEPLLQRLRRIVSTDERSFDEHYLEAVRQLARSVHLLPASSHEEFAGAGGLFRQCLEVAVYAAQAADGRIFTPTEDVQTRHAMEPRWKYAAFLAGLVCCVYRPLSACAVVAECGSVWPKHAVALGDWLAQVGTGRYFVQWSTSGALPATGAEGASVVDQVLPRSRLAWLDQGSPAIVRDVFAIALGQSRPGDSILGETVQRIREEVLRRDEVTRRSRYGRLRIGAHLEPYVMDALRTLLADGRWRLDAGGSLLYGTDGLYLRWPQGFEPLRQALQELGLPGVPRCALTLAELLGRGGAVLPEDSGQWLWAVVPALPSSAAALQAAEHWTALRFAEPGAVLGLTPAQPASRPFALAHVRRLLESAAAGPASGAAGGLPLPSTELPVAVPPERRATAAAAPPPAGTEPVRAQSYAVHLPEPARRLLRAADAELLGRWVLSFRQGRCEDVCAHAGGQVAVSREGIEALDLEFSRVVEMLDRHQWLGRPSESARGARVAEIQFGDRRKPGLVLSAQAVACLGFAVAPGGVAAGEPAPSA